MFAKILILLLSAALLPALIFGCSKETDAPAAPVPALSPAPAPEPTPEPTPAPIPQSGLDVGSAAALQGALALDADEIIINITGSFEYDMPIELWERKTVAINLLGNSITVDITENDSAAGTGIHVGSGSVMTIAGPGTLDVTGTRFGIYATDEGSIFETTGDAIVNATAVGEDIEEVYGVLARDGSTVNITGNATGSNITETDGEQYSGRGASAIDGGTVTVGGDVVGSTAAAATLAEGIGAFAADGGSVTVLGSAVGIGHNSTGAFARGGEVAVEGGIISDYCGVRAYDEGTVSVSGDVTANSEGLEPQSCGVLVAGGTVTINGDVAASGEEGIGVWSFRTFGKFGDGKVYIAGNISGDLADIFLNNKTGYSSDSPTQKGVEIDGQIWDEFYEDGFPADEDGEFEEEGWYFLPTYVYKRQV